MTLEAIKDTIQHRPEQDQRELAEWVEMNFLLPGSPEEIHREIGVGLEQLDRGDGISGEAIRAELHELKTEWLRRRQ